MEFALGNINYLAVLAAIIVNMGVGAIWYSPLLFANPWMAMNNFTEEMIRKQGSAARGYIISIIASILIAFALVWVAEISGASAI